MKKKRTIIVLSVVIVILLLAAVALILSLKNKKPEEKLVEKPVTEEQQEEPEPTVVGQETETIKGDIKPFKYGVKMQPVTYNTYDVYSDGTRKLVQTVDDILYFHEGYNATMEELNAESELAATVYIEYYEKVLELINKERSKAGVAPVVLDMELCKIAGLRAAEMEYSGKFSHERPDGSGCFKVTQYYNYTYKHLAENIVRWCSSAKTAVNAWKNDSTDYSYMLDARFTKLGVGHSDAGIATQWVTVFSD